MHRLRRHGKASEPIKKIRDTVERFLRSKTDKKFELDYVSVPKRDMQTWFIIHRGRDCAKA